LLDLLTLTLEAHSPERNHHRHYRISVGRDLLDDWTVAICYGRTGQVGRELRYASDQVEAMRFILRDRLRRRLSAPRHIGCPYQLTELVAAEGFDAAAWLPGEVMARLMPSQ
jgi:predicted DNA-binding WGR domain protein